MKQESHCFSCGNVNKYANGMLRNGGNQKRQDFVRAVINLIEENARLKKQNNNLEYAADWSRYEEY